MAEICKHCGQTEQEHYHGVTGIYCRGFYDNTKIFTPIQARSEGGAGAE